MPVLKNPIPGEHYFDKWEDAQDEIDRLRARITEVAAANTKKATSHIRQENGELRKQLDMLRAKMRKVIRDSGHGAIIPSPNAIVALHDLLAEHKARGKVRVLIEDLEKILDME